MNGVNNRRSLPWDDGEIVRWWLACGRTNRQIRILAELNDCPRERIRKILRAAGYAVGRKKVGGARLEWTAEQQRELVALRARGLRWREIAARVGHSERSCMSHVYMNGLYDEIAERRASCGERV